jgi:hypothetical protein
MQLTIKSAPMTKQCCCDITVASQQMTDTHVQQGLVRTPASHKSRHSWVECLLSSVLPSVVTDSPGTALLVRGELTAATRPSRPTIVEAFALGRYSLFLQRDSDVDRIVVNPDSARFSILLCNITLYTLYPYMNVVVRLRYVMGLHDQKVV